VTVILVHSAGKKNTNVVYRTNNNVICEGKLWLNISEFALKCYLLRLGLNLSVKFCTVH